MKELASLGDLLRRCDLWLQPVGDGLARDERGDNLLEIGNRCGHNRVVVAVKSVFSVAKPLCAPEVGSLAQSVSDRVLGSLQLFERLIRVQRVEKRFGSLLLRRNALSLSCQVLEGGFDR